jgi:hemerythrin-like domain-containing protein
MPTRKLSEIRTELLSHHGDVRAAIEELRGVVERLRSGKGRRKELRQGLSRLSEVVARHCRHEQDVLGELILSVDAWGAVRGAVLIEEHECEERELIETLSQTDTASELDRVLSMTSSFMDRLLDHMAREEKIVLAEDVLSDEIVVRDTFTG